MQRPDFAEGGERKGELRRISAEEIPWKAGDAVALDGVERAQDGTLIVLNQVKRPEPPTEFADSEGFLVQDIREGHAVELTQSEIDPPGIVHDSPAVQGVHRDEHGCIFIETADGAYYLLRSLGQKHKMPSEQHLRESLYHDTHFTDGPVADIAGADESMLVTQRNVLDGLHRILSGAGLQTAGAGAHSAAAQWREEPPEALSGEEQERAEELLSQLREEGSRAAKELIFRKEVHTPHSRTRWKLDDFAAALQRLQDDQRGKLDWKRGLSATDADEGE